MKKSELIKFKKKIDFAADCLCNWSYTKPSLPWRKERTPYRIFLAEMLLIRTRADVVAKVYDDVFRAYPDISSLAQAEKDELKVTLHSLGLSKRVPLIIKAAQYICENHDGMIPNHLNKLLKIPGIGKYTGTAIATFAYNQPLVPSDVNILRFASRLTGLEMKNRTKGSKDLRDITAFFSESLTNLPAEKLLDFTRLVCRSRNPLCDQCSLKKHCVYFRKVKSEAHTN